MVYNDIIELFEQLQKTDEKAIRHCDIFTETIVSVKTFEAKLDDISGNICKIRIKQYGGYDGEFGTSFDKTKIVSITDGIKFIKQCVDMLIF